MNATDARTHLLPGDAVYLLGPDARRCAVAEVLEIAPASRACPSVARLRAMTAVWDWSAHAASILGAGAVLAVPLFALEEIRH